MWNLLFILAGIYASWITIDLASERAWESIVAPVFFLLFLIALGFWLVLKAGFGRETDSGGF